MKTMICLLTLAAATLSAQDGAEAMLLVPWTKAQVPAPLFFSATAAVRATVGLDTITSEQTIRFRIHQGKAETLTLALGGAGEVTEVTGEGLRDWSVRVAEGGGRFLDLRPVAADGKPAESLVVVVRTRSSVENEAGAVLLPGPGEAAGFLLTVDLTSGIGVDPQVTRADALVPVEAAEGRRFVGTGAAELELRITPVGSGARGLELRDAVLTGRVAGDGNSVSFTLTGVARSDGAGSSLELLGGGAALSKGVSGEGWNIALRKTGGAWLYHLVAGSAGEFPLAIAFDVPVYREGDWRRITFTLPGGVVVPVKLEGLGGDVEFDRSLPVAPEWSGEHWRGFLPASGVAAMAWRAAARVADGSLVFSSSETTDVRVGSGLLRQKSVIDLRVLQGRLGELEFDVDGPGEVLSVSGDAVLGWNVKEEAGRRALEVRLSRPIESAGRLTLEAQAALGAFPVRAEALRVRPVGALRHSGWLRVANDGAVRIEVADVTGLIQLSPGQFPAGEDEMLRQVFVYRFPSADYRYAIRANQVLPEVGLTEVTVYEIAEADRRITADLELDIREAPMREWELEIPADHAVASVTGAEVADYAVASEVSDGRRRLKILFKQAVGDRQLVSLKLEKNEAAKTGTWEVQPLAFPGVKSHRGYIGAAAVPGFRLAAGGVMTGLSEVPVTFFPKQTSGLQQSFRLRGDEWSLALAVETLGQSIQADVFHLYSLKTGAVHGSVLMNFFVVGSPAAEWRISVPEDLGNIDVTGQNVGRDWRREGNTVIVPLSRPVLGAGMLLLTFEQPMDARGGKISPGEVSPLGVQGERGFVQVVSPLQVNHKSESQGALVIDATEIPTEFRLLSSAPTLGAWQYTTRDFKIGMEIEWFEPGETIDQVVDFQKLSTHVSRDGQWVTDARVFVKTRGRSALRMSFPQGAILWEAKVDGEAVNARVDEGQMLVPLPLRPDPNQVVEVSLRFGARAGNPERLRLTAPKLDAPLVISEWTVTRDEGRQLVPRGGTADLVKPVLAESGWEWMARHRSGVFVLLAAGLGGLLLGAGRPSGLRGGLSLAAGLLFVISAIALGLSAAATGRGDSAVLEYAAPVVAAGGEVSVDLGNLPAWRAGAGWGVWLALASGAAAVLRGLSGRDRIWLGVGVALCAAGLASVRGGGAWFFGIVALAGLCRLVLRFHQWMLTLRRAKAKDAVAAVMVLFFTLPWSARAAEVSTIKPAESMIHDWRIHDGRLFGTIDITLRGEPGDRFLLLHEPAVLGNFDGAGLRVVKMPWEGKNAYVLIAENAGPSSGRAVFEMPLANPADGWDLPAGPAAMRMVTLRWDQSGWEFYSDRAARIQTLPGLEPGESAALLVLGPADRARIHARPKQRDAGSEETRYFSETSNLFLPGPGVVNGRHLVTIRPAQGRVTSLSMAVPAGFTVSHVIDGPVGAWSFDPAKSVLKMAVEPAQTQGFSFIVESQRGADALPVDLSLEPLRVADAAGEVGLLGLAFGEEVRPEALQVEGLSPVNPEDFTQRLLHQDQEGSPPVLLQHAFRCGTGPARAKLRVTAVAPELRAESWQWVSLGEDRLVLAIDLAVTITRSGVFRLDLEVPEALEIESATGEGLNHWTEARIDGKRVVTFHLAGKTMGRRDFNLTLSGRPTGAPARWLVPRLNLRGASRETGVLTVVPERGFQVRAVDRRHVSQVDPRELAEAPKPSARAAAQPGALAYRMLQGDWALALAISRLDPWVTADVFHDATIREGQMLTRVNIAYRIENSAVKSRRVRIPGLDAESAATMRATGPAVADLVPLAGEEGLWEIRFQRGIAGDTRLDLEYQRTSTEAGFESVVPVILEDVRQLTYYVAVRAGGRLELEAGTAPRGWQRVDWAVARSAAAASTAGAAPALAFRVTDPEEPLPVLLKRHDLASLRKLRVSEGALATLLSPGGDALTAVNMKLHVLGKTTLRLKLQENSELFNVFVNGEGTTLVREGGDWLFHVSPPPDADNPAVVRFVYSSSIRSGGRLEGPVLDVPMENLTWRVLMPEGWRLASHAGDFELTRRENRGSFKLEDYQSFVSSKRRSDAKSAAQQLDQATAWLEAGDQEKASLALSNAVNNGLLDAASGEDARVQLRTLKTQQAVLGLNTRRQKLLLDNRHAAPPLGDDTRLQRAAEANPVLQGRYNFDPRQFDRFLAGNTTEENTALKEIANRIVTQQLAADPAPAALDITLPTRGTELEFTRSVQVDGDRPMAIGLKLAPARAGFPWSGLLLCLLLGALFTQRVYSSRARRG